MSIGQRTRGAATRGQRIWNDRPMGPSLRVPPPPKATSWWTQPRTREAFHKQAEAEAARMRQLVSPPMGRWRDK